ncbi:hypothetical protein EV652_10323 [Kribbella steppae]|uniref:Uncharacterized protein n=1 Tax=Kribbella steppae TaxID=2512223 RepID=A0A4R2HPD9_9ACTN|nr:hypothetical protein [Kribbella steppae]TCO33024.1 hypothetical protein EV652_10323 [Kribbella steppae]
MNNRTQTSHLDLIEPVAACNDTGWPAHRDVTPAPQPIANGKVVSICSCGRKFVGIDPDHADWQLNDHIDSTN